MPSGKHNEYDKGTIESDFVFKKIIIPAVCEVLGADIKVLREADRRLAGAITKEIVKNTIESDFAIVDITGQNPNVFFELGMRYALRRNCTILLRQEGTSIPFDVSGYRCVTYNPHFHNDEHSRNDLVEAIKESLAEKENRSDSLVFDVYPNLYVEIPGLSTEGIGALSRQMRWPEYWQQIKAITSILSHPFKNGSYVPTIIIAISNGGMMYADLLCRELYVKTPIITLWADRWSPKAEYFSDNIINQVTFEGVSTMLGKEKSEVLLVDDIVASGYTIRQALNFITVHLPNSVISFMPLFCKNEKYFDVIKDNILWFKPPFNNTEEEVKKLHYTDAHTLPYEKEIRSA